MHCQYNIVIEKYRKRYKGYLYTDDPEDCIALDNLKLHPESIIQVNGKNYEIGALLKCKGNENPTDNAVFFNERSQLDIGQYLFQQLFGQLPEKDLRQIGAASSVDIRIITQDDHIYRIPWNLLSNRGIFLSAVSWSTSVSNSKEPDNCTLPSSPRILAIIPQPAGFTDTKARAHIEDMENLLSPHNHLFSQRHHLKVVNTWGDFNRKLNHFNPHILYYFGYCIGDYSKPKFIFSAGDNNIRHDIPAGNFVNSLNITDNPIRLIYINSYQSDAQSLLGICKLLENTSPVLVINDTNARIEVVKSQALAFWDSVLVRGFPPHQAINKLHAFMTDPGIPTEEGRWSIPKMIRNYTEWTYEPYTETAEPNAPHRILRAGRNAQSAVIQDAVDKMLSRKMKNALVAVWYGCKNQGHETFHRRVSVEIKDNAPKAVLYEVRPDWPVIDHRPYNTFADMMLETFQTDSLSKIPSIIRARSRTSPDKPLFLYIRHRPVVNRQLMYPEMLKTYCGFLDTEFAPLFDRNTFIVSGVSFVVKNPLKFQKIIYDKMQQANAVAQHSEIRILPELGKITTEEFSGYIKDLNIELPPRHADRIIGNAVEKTQGAYDYILQELEFIATSSWDNRIEEVEPPGDSMTNQFFLYKAPV